MTERELHVLEIIGEADEPVGSWYIVNSLEKKGITISSATIGRLLNLMETRGFLEKHGIRGRTLTRSGREAIVQEYNNLKIEEHKKNLDNMINSDLLHKFLMVLEARQAIERTTARLAAKHITEEELEKLSEILDKQQKDYSNNISIAQDDIEFHRTIAMASRNEALYSLYMMLSVMGQQSELFEELRRRIKRHSISSHQNIYNALKDHSEDKAEKYMADHLDYLSSDVNTYWDEFKESRKITVDDPDSDIQKAD